MYEIERKENAIIIRKGGEPVYNVSLDSYVVFESGPGRQVAQVKDLTNEQLLPALANAIEIKV